MDIEIYHEEDPFETSLIDNIDENGYLSHNLSEFENDIRSDVQMDHVFENEKGNNDGMYIG